MEIASRLKELRILKKGTQEDYSKFAGVSLRAYQKWESGDNKPKFASVRKLCEQIGANASWVMAGEGPMLREDRVEGSGAMSVGGIRVAGMGQSGESQISKQERATAMAKIYLPTLDRDMVQQATEIVLSAAEGVEVSYAKIGRMIAFGADLLQDGEEPEEIRRQARAWFRAGERKAPPPPAE